MGSCLGQRDRDHIVEGARVVDQISELEGALSPRCAPALSGQPLEAVMFHVEQSGDGRDRDGPKVKD